MQKTQMHIIKIIIFFLSIIFLLAKISSAQVHECNRYYIFDLRDSTINSDPVIVFKMYTDTNTASNGSYTSLCFVHQNGDSLNPRPNFAFNTPVANTPSDTMEYVLYLRKGFTSFPTNFNGILLMEVPYCEIPYNHTAVSVPFAEIKETDIRLFPNPTTKHIQISNNSNSQITSIEIYDTQGRLIHLDSIKSQNINISTDELVAGVYHFKIYIEDQMVINKKIIKI